LQVHTEPEPEPVKGGKYRPSFFDDLLLAFYSSKMVEVSSSQRPISSSQTTQFMPKERVVFFSLI
jgi:hypothetical protein